MKLKKIRLYTRIYRLKLYNYIKKNLYNWINTTMMIFMFWLIFEGHNYGAGIVLGGILLIAGWRLYKGWGLYKSTIEYGARTIIFMQDERKKNKKNKKK